MLHESQSSHICHMNLLEIPSHRPSHGNSARSGYSIPFPYVYVVMSLLIFLRILDCCKTAQTFKAHYGWYTCLSWDGLDVHLCVDSNE